MGISCAQAIALIVCFPLSTVGCRQAADYNSYFCIWASADAEGGLCGQVTFPIRPLRVQDSSSERGADTFDEDKEAGATLYAGKQPSLEKQSSPEPNFGIARVPNMPSPGSRLPPLAPQSSGRPRQAPEDFLHLFGKQGGKPSASS